MHSIYTHIKTRIRNWKGADIEKIKKNIMKITDSDVMLILKKLKNLN